LPTKEPYQVMPSLSPEAYAALKADIEANGVQIPADVDEEGNYLDGIHRKHICEDLGLDCPTRVRPGLTEEQKRAYAWRVNLMRRHLSRAQKREIACSLRLEGWTQQAIAQALAIGQATVSHWIGEFIQMDQLPVPATIQGKDGKSYPSRKARRHAAPSAASADAEDHTLTPSAPADETIRADTGARPPEGPQARATGPQRWAARQDPPPSATRQVVSDPAHAREARRPGPDGRPAQRRQEPTPPSAPSPRPSTAADEEGLWVNALGELVAQVAALQGRGDPRQLSAAWRPETTAWCLATIQHLQEVFTTWAEAIALARGEATDRDLDPHRSPLEGPALMADAAPDDGTGEFVTVPSDDDPGDDLEDFHV